MRAVMHEGARETAASMRAAIDSALGGIAVSLRQARMVGILNVAASWHHVAGGSDGHLGGDALRRR
jgi:hypothetical protein